jgi:hypothetical protein
MISFVATIPSRQRGLRRNRARSPTIKTGSGWYPTQRHERRGPPAVLVQTWLDSSVLSPEQLAAHVRTELDSKGSWTDSCEVRYGGGPTARIDLVEIDGETWFRPRVALVSRFRRTTPHWKTRRWTWSICSRGSPGMSLKPQKPIHIVIGSCCAGAMPPGGTPTRH